MLLTQGLFPPFAKKFQVLFCIFCFIQILNVQVQPPFKDPSNPEGINVPTQLPPGQLYEILKDKYTFQKRGAIQVKGKGYMVTYLLTGKKYD